MKAFLKKNWPGLIAVVVAVAIGRFIASDGLASSFPDSDAEIERMFADAPGGQVYFAVKEHFPEDAAYWREMVRATMEARRNGEVVPQTKLMEVGADIRRRHAHFLLTAPRERLNSVIKVQRDLVAIFEEDVDACNRMAIDGPFGLTPAERTRLHGDIDTTVVVFEAMNAGRETPVERAAATEDDWALFDALYLESGYTQHQIQLTIEPDASDPELCEAFLGFFDVLIEADFEGSDSLIAEVAVAMFEY